MNKQSEPVAPVPAVPIFGVQVLHVIVCLVGDVEDLVHQLGAELSAQLQLVLPFVNFELARAFYHLTYLSLRSLLHLQDELLFFFNADLDVVLSAALVLCFAKLSVLNDDVFALSGSPSFVIKLLFLSALTLNKFK